MRSPWSATTAGEVARIEIGGTPARNNPAYWAKGNDGHPWVSIADLQCEEIRATKERITDLGVRCSNVKTVPAGTPLMSFKLTVGRVALAGVDLFTNEAIAAFHVDTAAVSPMFLRYVLPRSAARVVTDTAVKGATLNKVKLNAIPLDLPPLPEQVRIAAILDTVDEAIRKTEQVIAKLQQMKHGLLHDLLTRGIDENGELRDPERHPEQFKDSPLGRIPKEWDVRRLGEVVTGHRGVTYRPEQLLERHDSRGAVLLRSTNIQGGQLDFTDVQVVPRTIVADHQLAQLGDLVVCMSNGSRRLVGKSAQVVEQEQLSQPLTVGAFCSIFRPSDGNPSFIRLLFWSRWYKSAVDLALAGSAINNLKASHIEAVLIPWPYPTEQDAITERFKGFEARVGAEREELVKLRLLKQGLMDDLLTGRVRVPVPDERGP